MMVTIIIINIIMIKSNTLFFHLFFRLRLHFLEKLNESALFTIFRLEKINISISVSYTSVAR